MMPDFTAMAYLAMFGLGCAIVLTVAAIIGVPWGLWWLVHHVQFVTR